MGGKTLRLAADRVGQERSQLLKESGYQCHALGAIGRQVALQLAAMGVPWLQLIDPQEVEAVNLAVQGYLEENLGRPKVTTTAEMCRQINRSLIIEPLRERFRRSQQIGNILFCCVDSIEIRRLIWESVCERVQLFVDGRMSAEVIRILTVADLSGLQHYPATLFAAGEAYQGSCTAKSTIFTANIAAGLMLEQLCRWLRGMPLDPDLQLNLLASELSVA